MTGEGERPLLISPRAGREGNGAGRFPEVAGDPRVCRHHWRVSSNGVAVCSLCEEKRVFPVPGFGEPRVDGLANRRGLKGARERALRREAKPRGLEVPGLRPWIEE